MQAIGTYVWFLAISANYRLLYNLAHSVGLWSLVGSLGVQICLLAGWGSFLQCTTPNNPARQGMFLLVPPNAS